MLNEPNETVDSGPSFFGETSILGAPSKISHIVSFCYMCFFKDNYEVGRKSEKHEMDSK